MTFKSITIAFVPQSFDKLAKYYKPLQHGLQTSYTSLVTANTF